VPAEWKELTATRPRNLRESLRHCYNSLKRDGLVPEFEVVTSAAGATRALRDFFELHAARADLKHTNVFAHPAARAFLEDVCARFAHEGTLHDHRSRGYPA
jgi:GNAT acetyltransferase-like protein